MEAKTMKKIISAVLVCVLLACTLFALASCGKTLSGEYQDALKLTTLKFSGSNVTITVDNVIGDDTVLEGKYAITEDEENEGKYIITFTFDDEEDADDWDTPMSFSEGEEDGKKYIKLGGLLTYYKK